MALSINLQAQTVKIAAAANLRYILVEIQKVKTYALGKLVIWSNMVDVSKGLEILTDKSVNRIALALALAPDMKGSYFF